MTRLHPSSVSRLLATLVDAGMAEHVVETGRYRLGLRPRRARECRARLARSARGRPPAPARARRGDRRDHFRAGRPGRDHRGLRPERFLCSERGPAGATQRRPRHGHRQVALASRRRAAAGRLRAFTARTIVDRGELHAIERVRRQGWAQAAGEREDDSARSRRLSEGAAASWRPSSASRAPGHASTPRRWHRRSSRCSRVQRRSPTL